VRIRRTLGALTLGAAVLIGAGTMLSAASADESAASEDITWDRIYTFEGIKVYMRERGDVFKVCDTLTNEFAATLNVNKYRDRDPVYTIKPKGGKGSCLTRRASDGGVYDLPENQKFTTGHEGEADSHWGGGIWINDQDPTT
jgi:hypothetical protein